MVVGEARGGDSNGDRIARGGMWWEGVKAVRAYAVHAWRWYCEQPQKRVFVTPPLHRELLAGLRFEGGGAEDRNVQGGSYSGGPVPKLFKDLAPPGLAVRSSREGISTAAIPAPPSASLVLPPSSRCKWMFVGGDFCVVGVPGCGVDDL